MAKKPGIKLIANNKKAFHDYFIEDTYEAGIALAGTEVKSLRMGKCSIKESFVRIQNGDVSRGICTVNQEGKLVQIVERTQIEKRKTGIVFTEDKGQTWEELDGETLVSMNMWGFTESILQEIKKGFPAFLEKGLQENPMKCEYFLPSVVSELIESEKAIVTVLESEDKWYGVTYREDKPLVMNAIEKLKDEGIYPQHLWKD